MAPSVVGGFALLPRAHSDPVTLTDEEASHCNGEPVELGMRALRVASIFILLVASLFGAATPILLARQRRMRVPKATFFIFKYFGTGVIVATAWMHLLAPAIEQLSDHCVGHGWPAMADYPWALCIGLMTVMVMFLVELVVSGLRSDADDDGDGAHAATTSDSDTDPSNETLGLKKPARGQSRNLKKMTTSSPPPLPLPLHALDEAPGAPNAPGDHHLAHGREHAEGDGYGKNLAGQLTAIFILEFGVVFHSIFIGLTLGTTAQDQFVVLLVVLVFHQMFEGLGLGSRLAVAPWARGRGWIPYVLAAGFALSTPVGIAAGIGARPANAATQKLVNGIFDSISAGILMYTGLVELLAHELMFNPEMRRAPLRVQLYAYACVASGVALMALLAKWA
ncbi:hypothetical protein CDD83_10017 [Cordyceps sp. RAO-2017]|nr:hypothetical protein CDD83_10017 [Cordyceps sp. RAO-2017]